VFRSASVVPQARARRGARLAQTLFMGAFAAAFTIHASEAIAGGYYLGPIGAQAVGRGGAFTAKADDLSAVYYNPAGFAFLDTTVIELGNKFSYNFFEFQRSRSTNPNTSVVTSFAPVTSDQQFQPLDPLLGVGTNFGLADWAFALVAYAGSGVSQMQFPEDGPQRYLMVQREGIFVNYSLNAAWQPHPRFAVGVSAQVVAVPSLKYQLVVNSDFSGSLNDPVANNPDMMATIEGQDLFTMNAAVGALFRVSPAFELGLSGQVIPAEIEATGPLKLEFVNPESQAANGLSQPVTYRNDDPADDVTLTLPLPMTARLGARYVHRRPDNSELFDVELDVIYETLSRVERFTMDSRGLIADVGANEIDVGVIRVEKHWNDTVGVALGGDFNAIPDTLTLRAGAYYETAASDPEYTNVDFVTGQQIGGTLGATLRLGHFDLSLGYEFRTQPEVVVRPDQGRVYQVVPLRPEAKTVVNAGTYRATSHSAALGVAYRF
jgi:long-chain fatty acid transport protein